MKVTHVVESLSRGGLERVVVDLAKAQLKKGYECEVLCIFEGGILADEARDAGMPVRVLGKEDGLDFALVSRLRKCFHQAGADVVHTHNAVAHYYSALAAAGSKGRVFLNTRHGMGSFARLTKREVFFRIAMMTSDYGVMVCQAAADDAVARGRLSRKKARVVRNGTNLNPFLTERSVGDLRAHYGFDKDQILVMNVGRLNRHKGQTTLLRAFEEVDASAHLVIVGDGELRTPLEEQASSPKLRGRVTFMGDRADVPDLLACADLFVLSSNTEGYSIALLEACASGLPIVATDVGGNKEIVHHGTTGLIVPPKESEPLTEAINQMIEDSDGRTQMGAAGRAWALDNGTMESMVTAYEHLYRREPAAA